MTSQDELRDRIKDAMVNADRPHDEPDADLRAQAVIDDLGLEVVSDGGRPEWKLQIIGKWEKK